MICHKFIIALSIVIFIHSATVLAKTVPSLDDIPEIIKYSEGQQFWDEQMRGIQPNKQFTPLPQGIDKTDFIEWLAPNEDPTLLSLIGAKVWGKDNNIYIGILSFSNSGESTQFSENFSLSEAGNFYLGVFQWQNQRFKAIAKSDGYLDAKVFWMNTDLQGPAYSYEEYNEGSYPQSYSKLDLAPYRITPNIMAFGVRANFYEMYAGGGAYFEALQLFMVKNGQIVNILSEPMYYYQNIAGEWHEDGTRDHDISEGKNILMVLSSQTHGYYDLRIKSLDANWRQDFVWSIALERYVIK